MDAKKEKEYLAQIRSGNVNLLDIPKEDNVYDMEMALMLSFTEPGEECKGSIPRLLSA